MMRARVRHRSAGLVELAREPSGAGPELIDDSFRQGMALNAAATLGVEDLSAACARVQDELHAESGTIGAKVPSAQIGESDVTDTDTAPG
jgi:hypothetical protein